MNPDHATGAFCAGIIGGALPVTWWLSAPIVPVTVVAALRRPEALAYPIGWAIGLGLWATVPAAAARWAWRLPGAVVGDWLVRHEERMRRR